MKGDNMLDFDKMGYGRKTVFQDTYKRLQKETHFTHRQMHKEFPDLCAKIEQEELENNVREYLVLLNKIDKNILD